MKTLFTALSLIIGVNSLAASTQAKIACTFSEQQKTILAVDLKNATAKQLNNSEYNEFPVIGDMNVTSHTTIYGDSIKLFNQMSTTGHGQKVVWDAQLVLMGSNQDDSKFTLIIAYRFKECQGRSCTKAIVKATLISYWDGLDGEAETTFTDKCNIEL